MSIRFSRILTEKSVCGKRFFLMFFRGIHLSFRGVRAGPSASEICFFYLLKNFLYAGTISTTTSSGRLNTLGMPGNDQVKPTVSLLSNAIKINRHSTTAIQNRFPPAGHECLLLNNVLISGIRLMNLFTAAILNKFPSKIFTFLFIRAASAALISIFHDKWILMVFWVFPQTFRTVRCADLAKSILWSKKTQARTW